MKIYVRNLLKLLAAFILVLLTIKNGHSQAQETKGFYITDDNNKMYYESYGSGESAILFVHGWSANCRTWDDQIDFFKDKFKVILIDLPGFGNFGT